MMNFSLVFILYHLSFIICNLFLNMQFLNSILSTKTKKIREELLHHPFWISLEKGTLSKAQLGLFAMQDYWLASQAERIDTLIISSMKDYNLRGLLLERLAARRRSTVLLDFAEGVGVSKKDLENTEPLAGCMALTTYFYWMIDNTSDLEKIACIDASKEIFSFLCVRVTPALKKYYNLNEKQAAFFAVHENVLERIKPVDEYIEAQVDSNKEKKKIDLAVRLSYEYEKMFYDTILKN